MKPQKTLLKTSIFFVILIILFSNIQTVFAGRPVQVNGYMKQDRVAGGEGWVNYSFFGDNHLNIMSNVNLDVDLRFNAQLQNRQISISINNSESAALTIDTEPYAEHFQQQQVKQARNRYRNLWGSFIRIQTNVSIDAIQFSVTKNNSQSVGEGNKWALYSSTEWELIETTESDDSVNTTIVSLPTEVYLSVFAPSISYTWIIVVGSIVGIVIISFTILMSKTEYREFIRNRIRTQPAKYTLSIEDVLENENRSKIIDFILDSPGIHFNELLRETDLSPGNLVWHLDVLETYHIIGKKNVGQYLVYFPLYDYNPMSNIDIKLAKSDTTLQILNMIEEYPGTYGSEIANKLDLDHKTVKYHIEKLKEINMIETKKVGRKNLLYPHLGINDVYKDRKK
ncbi:MAG: winged helix-turn-helix transcriptional regulator [Promethearchaeota archaeon]|nr:MAG: winged helix-turn-helix transcriptional regulator [Candidatus Lokiarchaeota archaeon]